MILQTLQDQVAFMGQLLFEYRSDVLCDSLGYGFYFLFFVVELADAQHLREILLTRESQLKKICLSR